MNSIKIICLLLLFVSLGFSQSFPLGNSSPGDGFNAQNMSSPFGPRNLGKLEYPSYTDNTHKYDYDFHGGVDIAAVSGTNVWSMYAGEVIDYQDDGDSDDFIDIKYNEDGEEFVIRYMHMDPNDNLCSRTEVKTVTAGQNIGKVRDIGANHLDVRYTTYNKYLNNNEWGENTTYSNALSPVKFLADDEESFVILNENEEDISDGNGILYIYTDETNRYANRQNHRYFEFMVESQENELDLGRVVVELSGTQIGGLSVHENELLDGSWNPDVVDYKEKINNMKIRQILL